MFNNIKKRILVIFFVLISTNIYAQVPQGFNFQAVARGVDGVPLLSQELGVQITLVKGTEDGGAVYVESHNVTTNPIGLIQLVIGEGTPAEGNNFDGIDWATDNYFVKLEIDPAGGTEYEELGTSRLLSVPYALLAENVVNRGSGGGEFPLEINLNTANVDSSLIINIEGDRTAKPFQVFSSSSVYNGAIWGEAISESSNEGSQRGVLGFANGLGTGQHTGVFGGAVNFDATGSSRQGIYGQAASKSKFNFGVRALAQGEGSGEIVAIGDEMDGNAGSFNIGGGFYPSGNINGNVGVDVAVEGSSGARVNLGAEFRVSTTASGQNSGVQTIVNGSSSLNRGFWGLINGNNNNVGMELNVNGGSSNRGLIINADTAAILNGDVIINGNLTYDGMSGSSSSTLYNLNTTAGDTSFIISADGSESISGALKVRSQTEGQNRGVDSRVTSGSENSEVQIGTYGRASGEGSGTHYGSYGISLSNGGGNNYGSYGYAQGVGKYNFGVQAVAVGSGSGEVVAIGDEVDGNFGSYNIGGGFYPSGNTNGNTGIDVSVEGDQGQRINIGGEFRVSTTASGHNSGVQTIVNGSSSLNRGFWGLINGDNNNVGMDLTVNGGTSNIGLIINAETAAELNGNTTIGGNLVVNGFIEHTGTITQTSDRRLKTNIQPLKNSLENTLKLRGVSYNWIDDDRAQDNQIGVIAQEVEEIYPEFVHTDEEGMKSVNYSQMTAVLIEAVKALNKEIQDLKEYNEVLQAKVEGQKNLEYRLAQIEALLNAGNYSELNIQSEK
tara:strand:- start:4385 stop:6727 length:2343 start_codon:yes stop_codon:yes gene_type:complete